MEAVLALPRHALDDALARLRSLHPAWPHVYAVDPEPVPGLPWQPLESAAAPLLATAQAASGGSRSLAATSAGLALAHAVLGRVTAALVTGRVAFDVGPGALLVALDEGGYPSRVALARGTRVERAEDDDATEVLDRLARAAAATLTPLFEQVRSATRFGALPLWNLAADAVLSTATDLPAAAGGDLVDQLRGRSLGEALVAALARHGGRSRCRARVQQLPGASGPVAVAVRGACCLAYRAEPATPPGGPACCTTCPLVSDAARAQRWLPAATATS